MFVRSLKIKGRLKFRCLLPSIVLWLVSFSGAAQGAGHYAQIDYAASTTPGELQLAVTYTLWIPDGVTRLRGVIVHQHGGGYGASFAGASAAYDLHWQALAKKWDCALLGASYHLRSPLTDSPGGSLYWMDPHRGSDKAFLRALVDLGGKSGHPELATVPWCLWGHSAGGLWSNVMMILHPDRVLAVWLRSGSTGSNDKPEFSKLTIPDSVYMIPTMVNAGVGEKPLRGWTGSVATFQTYRAKGALIGFAADPVTGHWCGDSRYLAIPFFDACLAMRLPDRQGANQTLKPMERDQAWLAPMSDSTAVPAADYRGDPNTAVWLPNEAVAEAWMEYVKHGTVGDVTPPPAPFDVEVKAVKGQGNVITWDAEADFESGIGGFFIVRDGKGLASLPERTPDEVFGRPLFQGLSYHDTPVAPIPKMRFVDTSAKFGEKHTYTVIEINSAGLASKPSVPASIGGNRVL